MTQKEINELKERCYAIGNTKFPLDTFFNDIRDNDNPKFNKDDAYEDLKLIVDEIYRLRGKETPKKLKSKTDKDGRLLWICPNCGDVYMKFWSDVETITCRKYCDECGQKLDWSGEDGKF